MTSFEFSVGTAFTPTELDLTAEVLEKDVLYTSITLDDEDGIPGTGGEYFVLDNTTMGVTFAGLHVGDFVDIEWIQYLGKRCILTLAIHANPPEEMPGGDTPK